MSDLLRACREGHAEEPQEWEQGDQGNSWGTRGRRPARSTLESELQNNGSGQAQSNAGEHLIGDPEDWPQRSNPAFRITHPHDQKEAPAQHHAATG